MAEIMVRVPPEVHALLGHLKTMRSEGPVERYLDALDAAREAWRAVPARFREHLTPPSNS